MCFVSYTGRGRLIIQYITLANTCWEVASKLTEKLFEQSNANPECLHYTKVGLTTIRRLEERFAGQLPNATNAVKVGA
jgi:hypothetical protein